MILFYKTTKCIYSILFILLFGVIIGFGFNLKAQSTANFGDFYDFEVGDEFHYSYEGTGGPYHEITYTNNTVISKNYSAGVDSIFYTYFQRIHKRTYPSPGIGGRIIDTIYNDTLIQKISITDTLADVIPPCDTNSAYFDSTYYAMDSIVWCYRGDYVETYLDTTCGKIDSIYSHGEYTYIPRYSISGGVQHGERKEYKRGLGQILYGYYYEDIDPRYGYRINKRTNLIWYRKINGDSSCNTPYYVGVNEQKKEIKFRVYPNPVSTILVVKNKYNESLVATFLDLNGREVKQVVVAVNQTKVDVSFLENGIFFIRLTSLDNRFIGISKMVKF